MQASLISGEAQVVLYATHLAANHHAETRLAETCAGARHAVHDCQLVDVRDQVPSVLTTPEVAHGVLSIPAPTVLVRDDARRSRERVLCWKK